MYHPVSKLFTEKNYWNQNKNKLLFSSKEDLHTYQSNALKQICSFHSKIYDMSEIITDIPKFKTTSNFMEMKSSGTTSGNSKQYAFPRPQYELIEEHHIWRIENSHHITTPGNVLVLVYDDLVKFNIYKPNYKYYAAGNNNVMIMSYGSQIDWQEAVLYMSGYKYIIMSPTEVQLLYQVMPKFCCPVILTRETVTSNVLEMARSMFPLVINKLRCWDGGLSFFSCPENRLHIYDELCYVEKTDKLISTDFYNYCHPFIKYYNGDDGVIEEGLCKCGLYGKYFEEFYGRSVDAIKVEGKLVSGHKISFALQTILKELDLNLSYKIIQDFEGVKFYYVGDVSDAVLEKIVKCITWIVKDRVIAYNDPNLLDMKSKNCLVKSLLIQSSS